MYTVQIQTQIQIQIQIHWWLILPTLSSSPFSFDKYFHPLHPGVNSFLESLSCTSIFLFLNLARQSCNLLQAHPCKPVTIFGQLHPGAPKPPPELPGWAPPGPLGLQGILRCLLPRYLDGYRRHMGITCRLRFFSSINACFRSQDENWQNLILEASLLNVTQDSCLLKNTQCNDPISNWWHVILLHAPL